MLSTDHIQPAHAKTLADDCLSRSPIWQFWPRT